MGGEHERRARVLLPQQGEVAGVHARGVRFDVQAVAVVPEGDETEVVGRSGDRGAHAEHDDRARLERPQEPAVAVGVRLAGVDAGDSVGGDEHRQRRGDVLEVAVVGHADDGRAAAGESRGGELGERAGRGGHPATAGGRVGIGDGGRFEDRREGDAAPRARGGGVEEGVDRGRVVAEDDGGGHGRALRGRALRGRVLGGRSL